MIRRWGFGFTTWGCWMLRSTASQTVGWHILGRLLTILAAAVLTGCASADRPDGGTTSSPDRASTRSTDPVIAAGCSRPAPEIPAPGSGSGTSLSDAASLPRELWGLWCSADGRAAEQQYLFDSSGTFGFHGYLWQDRPEGQATFERTTSGIASVQGDELVLDIRDGTSILVEPIESVRAGMTTAASTLQPTSERHRWSVRGDGNLLILTDQYGVEVDYDRVGAR